MGFLPHLRVSYHESLIDRTTPLVNYKLPHNKHFVILENKRLSSSCGGLHSSAGIEGPFGPFEPFLKT